MIVGAVQGFLAVGDTPRNILEVVFGVSREVLSDYTDHLVDAPIDKPFQQFEWHRREAA